MPEKYGDSMQNLMHNLKHGPHHKNRTHKQEVAIALKFHRGKKKKRKGKDRK
jgi:hypothetical protein